MAAPPHLKDGRAMFGASPATPLSMPEGMEVIRRSLPSIWTRRFQALLAQKAALPSRPRALRLSWGMCPLLKNGTQMVPAPCLWTHPELKVGLPCRTLYHHPPAWAPPAPHATLAP